MTEIEHTLFSLSQPVVVCLLQLLQHNIDP